MARDPAPGTRPNGEGPLAPQLDELPAAVRPVSRERLSWHARLRSPLRATFASLAYRDFTYLWLGQVTHAGALWLEQVARPLLILAMTGSPLHLGMVIAARTVASVSLGLVAGVVADSFDRRMVMLVTKSVVLVLASAFAALVLLDLIEVWHIYAFTVMRGATMAFDQPARRAMIPSIVPPHLVTNAMALSTGSIQVMRIVGAAAAGLLIGFAGVGLAFTTVAALYIFALLFTFMLHRVPQARRGYRGMRQMGDDLGHGFRYAWTTPAIRGILVIALGYFAFGMSFIQVFAPLFATNVLDIGEEGFGYMMAVTGIGGVAGAAVLAAASPSHGHGRLMLGMLAVVGVLLMAFSASTYLESVPIAFLVVAVLGFSQSIFLPLINASLVRSVPEDMRGRMLGLLSLDRGMTAFGGGVAGLLAATIGTQLAQMVFGAACLATAVAMYTIYPPLRRLD